MNIFRSVNIKTRLLLMVLLSVFVIVSIAISFFFTSTQLVLEKSKEYAFSTAYNVKNNFNTYLASCMENINILSTDVSFIRGVMGYNRAVETGDWSSYSALQYELYKTARKIPGLIGIEIAGTTSSITHNTRPITTGAIESSNILQSIMNSEKRVQTLGLLEMESRPHISNEGRYAVIIGVQIKSYVNGDVVGAIILALSDYHLSKDIYIWEDEINSELLVIAPNGKKIVATSQELSESEGLMSLDSEGEFSGLRNLNEKEFLISQLYTDPLDWRILLLTDYNNFSAPLLSQFNEVLLVTALLLLFLLIAVGLVIKSINNPIKQLVSVMKRTSRENNFPMVEVSGYDELTYLGSTFNDMSQRIQKLIEEIKTVTNKKRSAELLALYSQISPHLLYNTLDSINWIAFTSGKNEICEIISTLSDFYRLTLDKGQSYHSLSRELEQINKYLELQKFNYHSRFEYTIDINDKLNDYLVPKIIFQPIVENALTHGFSEPKLVIKILVYKQSDHLVIDITDNGSGVGIIHDEIPKPSYGEDCHGYGLYNINERIKLFYGERYGIHLLPNDPKGLLVRFLLPLTIDQNVLEDF